MSPEALVLVAIGVICGLVPLVVGALKGRVGVGIIGFVFCTIAGLTPLGLLGIVPLCALFTSLTATGKAIRLPYSR